MPSELPEPTEYLKSMLGIPEYNEMNSILTEAIHEIQTLRKDALDTPSERERRYMEALNRRDEARRMLCADSDMYMGGVKREIAFMRGAVHALASLSWSGLTPTQSLDECQKLRARVLAGKRVPALMDYLIAVGQGRGDEVLSSFDQEQEVVK